MNSTSFELVGKAPTFNLNLLLIYQAMQKVT